MEHWRLIEQLGNVLLQVETIWIICHRDMQPLIRYHVGEWKLDPVTQRYGDQHKKLSHPALKRHIPIFYVAMNPKEKRLYDSLAWSIVYGALTAYDVCRQLSQHAIPERFYVSFPYAAYSLKNIREYRYPISSQENFFISYEGKTIVDGLYLGFTFNEKSARYYWKKIKELVRKKEKLLLANIFDSRIIETGNMIAVPSYYQLDSWKGYSRCIASEYYKCISSGLVTKDTTYHEWNPLAIDDDEIKQTEKGFWTIVRE